MNGIVETREEQLTNWLCQTHLLIAGATGSGKSVLLNSLICHGLKHYPNAAWVMIDPKRVELNQYKNIEQCLYYASEKEEINKALDFVVNKMESIYKDMQIKGLKSSPYRPIFLVIDEYADLVTTDKKRVEPKIQRIAQLGRAANIHLIICTQRPTAQIITGNIKVNIDSRIALRCPTAQDSRNIIRFAGAEKLPRYGKGLFVAPCVQGDYVEVDIPYTSDEEQMQIIAMQPKKETPKQYVSFWSRLFA